jgi:recombination protein RecA
MRKLTGIIGKTGTVAIFINQLRLKVGIVYGNPEVTAGGNALKYYSSVRIDVRRSEALKDTKGTLIGNRTKAKVVKNKVAPPFKEAFFDIMFGEGISKVGEILDLAVELGIIQKSGAWFSYGEMRLGQGRDNTKKYLQDNPDFAAEIEQQVRDNADKLAAPTKKGERKAAASLDDATAADDADDSGEDTPAEEAAPAPKAAKAKRPSIDIMVED